MEGTTLTLDRKDLKAKYLDCFAARASSAQTLLEVIKGLLHLGVLRATLYRWGLAAGYSHATVRSLLSRAFCALGLRQRRVGAGRKPAAQALELLAHARREYGNRALRLLRAAYRAGKSQDAAPHSAASPADSVPELIAAPQLLAARPIVGPQLDAAAQESSPASHLPANGEPQRLPRLRARSVSKTLRN